MHVGNGTQCRPRPDAKPRGVWSGSSLLTYRETGGLYACWSWENNAGPDQSPHHVESDQDLHC